jgi:hypothetical protein
MRSLLPEVRPGILRGKGVTLTRGSAILELSWSLRVRPLNSEERQMACLMVRADCLEPLSCIQIGLFL